MKKLFYCSLFFWLLSSSMFAQGRLVFSYDQAGNQIKRELPTPKKRFPFFPFIKSKSTTTNVNAQATSKDLNTTDQLRVYPNPTNGLLTADWLEAYSGKVTLVKVQGISNSHSQTFTVFGTGKNKININLSSQPAGIYVVLFYLTDGSMVSKKIIKL